MRPEGASLCQKTLKPGIPLCVIGGSRVHDAEPETLDLFGAEPLPVQIPVFRPVVLKKKRLREGIHRIGYLAEHAAKTSLPRHFGVGADDLPVVLELVHPHVLHAASHRRDAFGGDKHHHVGVKQLLRRDRPDLRKPVVVPGPGDLVLFKGPPGGDPLVQIADADLRDAVAAQKMQSRQEIGSHISDGQNVHPFFSRRKKGRTGGTFPPFLQQVFPSGLTGVYRSEFFPFQEVKKQRFLYSILLPVQDLRLRGHIPAKLL